jgi:hypothetical protein
MAAWSPAFRRLLPMAQTVSAACFGGIGLWQRARYLNTSWLGWNSTERFHVWPWPFKFAVVTNLPAFLFWSVLGWPIGERWPDTPEGVMFAPTLFFVAILWYGIGVWMDRRWDGRSRPASEAKTPWILLAVFTALCVIAVFVRVQFPTSDYICCWVRSSG